MKAVAVALGLVLVAPGVGAVERVVSSTADAGEGTLREAVAAAASGDVVVLPGALGNVVLSQPVAVAEDLELTVRGDGEGAGITAADGAVTSFFELGDGSAVTLEDLEVSGGAVEEAQRWAYGSVFSGSWQVRVRLDGCRFEGNRGTIMRAFDVQIDDCVFTGNFGDGLVAADLMWIRNSVMEGNEGTVDAEVMRMVDCVVRGNTGRVAVGLCSGVIRRCLVADNTGTGILSDPDPGQLLVDGCSIVRNGDGGLVLGEDLRVTVMNTTVSGNVAGNYAPVDLNDTTEVLFLNCTVTDNVAGEQPWRWAVTIEDNDAPGVKFQNCIVAGNHRTAERLGDAPAVTPGTVDLGGNLIGVADAGLGALVELGTNGMFGHVPVPGGAAADAGVRPGTMVGDMAGWARVAGGAIDAGAVESGSVPLADGDADGIEDAWETRFGLDPADGADAIADKDGDGLSNRDEFAARTDPADADSDLRLRSFSVEGKGYHHGTGMFRQEVSLGWRAQPGVEYEVEFSADLEAWERVLPGIGDDDRAKIGPALLPGEEALRWVTDEMRPGYYRLRAVAE